MGKFLTKQNYKDLVDLLLDDEYTVKEIAEEIKISVPTVRVKRDQFLKAGVITDLGKMGGRPTFGEGAVPFAAWWLQSKQGKLVVHGVVIDKKTEKKPVVKEKEQTGHIQKRTPEKVFEEVIVEKVYNVAGDRYIKINGKLIQLT